MENFKKYLDLTGEYGVVARARDNVVIVEGLPRVRLMERVLFERGSVGIVLQIDALSVRVALLTGDSPANGERVVRVDKRFTIPIYADMQGMVVNALGEVIENEAKGSLKVERQAHVDINPLGVHERAVIGTPLATSVSVVDILLPLGAGQKELIIGDHKTGKTEFLLTVLLAQADTKKGLIVALIGKRKSEINHIRAFLKKNKLDKKVTLVVSSSDDPDYTVFLTPFTAMTIAESYKKKGVDSVVILDDLSTHARAYRQMSLLMEKFPGRESYPDDIFYTHARLLERAGNFVVPDSKKAVSITCLPVAETVEGDLSGYITTNLMGITDGHLFFDAALFERGTRPAINIQLSVTRVGRQTLSPLVKEINQKITAFMAEYESLQNLAHFGTELSPAIREKIERGLRLQNFFQQEGGVLKSPETQLLLLGLAWNGNEQNGVKWTPAALTKWEQAMEKVATFDAFLAAVKKLQPEFEKIVW